MVTGGLQMSVIVTVFHIAFGMTQTAAMTPDDHDNLLKLFSAAVVGAAGTLAMWFNDIVNGDAVFSFRNFAMLVFIGATIGVLAVIIAPMFGVNERYVMVFACSCAAAHKYLFKSAAWFMEKWTTK
jgi:hypothetical protein